MDNYNVYQSIAERTNGDIYVGVVGPVRTGKSTFIAKFMQNLVLPNIDNKFTLDRAIDEMPQAADGKTIMTTQPRFVPSEAVKIKLDNSVELNVRMIDCVGYLVDGAIGHEENFKPRLVKTPWSDQDLPFAEAAEIGTKKVIAEHSTIGILMTTDGTITDIPRSAYIKAEENVYNELKASKKPFVIVLNSKEPNSINAQKLKESLQEKYNVSAFACDVLNLTKDDITEIFAQILNEFPVTSLQVKLPKWLQVLSYASPIINTIINELIELSMSMDRIGNYNEGSVLFQSSADFEPVTANRITMGNGEILFEIVPKPELFYKVLSYECGVEINSDFSLMSYIKDVKVAKQEYEKIKYALEDVKNTGYGVVVPTMEEMTLEEPEIVKQGSRYGVRLKASAPSLHLMRVDIETEVCPVVGSEQQSEELVKYLMAEFESNPSGIWETNMFGKSLHMVVKEGLNNKLLAMPVEAQTKMRKTLTRIVNEGRGGIICILL
ncbi:MAG: stage IV sporulation protein A [Clostridia bacterium]|jgi:stage IV sporulation protein A|nr:stage IV sporulation protein A [Clostridia bacterium]